MWCIGQFYILFWIRLESGTAYCLAEDTCIGLTLSLFIVSSTLRSLFSPSDGDTAETLGEEFKLAGSI